MTVDEELSLLENSIRQLKIEYDVYFGGGAKKPPADTEWRVNSFLKKYSDGKGMNFSQRFRFNTLQQKFALYNSLWQQKLKIKEEGYRRPQDAVLGIAGMRIDEQQAAAEALAKKRKPPASIHSKRSWRRRPSRSGKITAAMPWNIQSRWKTAR